ncbi:MAG: M48 family metalloprotease [Gemmatimonadetes bacterium]|nr:M48 family metalloprotease [Gemmatimonadota bacterium]
MNAALNKLGSQLFGWFGQLSIELAALAVLVLVACYLLPIKSPALRHLLWAVVLLKPLVSIAVSSPYTLFTPFVPLVEPSQDTFAFSPVEHPTMQVAASPAIATSSVQLTTAGWGAILWIAGAALLIGRILVGYGIVWCLRQQAQVQHDGPLCDALRQARRTLNCYSKVEVATSPSISSPMALGILRPIIVFPDDLVEKLRPDELTLILMHELAHVRRWDNLTRLLHRLVSAVLFFHPAVWLCGRMLRREAEQACDDLVVCATGRSEAYARGLTHVAERAAHLNPLISRIPTMNAFAAESDLALRIRRTLGGGARQMGMRARVLAAVLLCPLAAVTLPSVSKISAESSQDERPFVLVKQEPVTFATLKEELQAKRRLLSGQDERLSIVVDQDGNMKLNDNSVTFATLKEELQEKRQLLDNTTMIVIQSDGHTPHGQIVQIMYVARQVGLVDMVVRNTASEVANVAAEPSQGEHLLLVLDQDGSMKLNDKPVGLVNKVSDKPVTFTTLKEELQAKRQLLDNTTMIVIQVDERAPHGKLARIMDIARQAELVDQVIATESQPEVAKVAIEPSQIDRIWQEAMATDPDEWSDELKTQLLALKPNRTIGEITYAVRQSRDKIRQEAMATDPDRWSDELKTQLLTLKAMLFGLEPDSTIEEIAEKVRQRRLWRQAEETDSDEWSDELKTQLLALKPGNISYEITTASPAEELFISNVVGELVRTFFLGDQSPGKYSIVWDGRDDAGHERSNGVYFYSLKSDREANKRRLYRTILVR